MQPVDQVPNRPTINQTNQSIKKPNNQLANYPLNQPINQPTSKSINELTQPTNQSTDQPANPPTKSTSVAKQPMNQEIMQLKNKKPSNKPMINENKNDLLLAELY